MIASDTMAVIRRHLRANGQLVLFLDYDGTLVPIARTPEQARPDKDLLTLLTELVNAPTFDTIILSGRSLSSLQTMLPISGLTLAGTYGIEIWREGKITLRGVETNKIRPVIKRVKSEWKRLVGKRKGFLLEDKGLTIALHARWAKDAEADLVLETARDLAFLLLPTPPFRLLGGDRFLEVAPSAAHKGQTVDWLLDQIHAPNALPVYFGDDDKDEEAFIAVHGQRGISIGVDTRFPLAQAMEHVTSPQAVRDLLRQFLLELNLDGSRQHLNLNGGVEQKTR